MTDFLNGSFPVANPDASGNYPWLAIRAGSECSYSKPINMKGALVVNQPDDRSIDIRLRDNAVGSGDTTGGAGVPVRPNTALFVNEAVAKEKFARLADQCGATNGTAAPATVGYYLEGQVQTVVAGGENLLIGVSSNGALPLAPHLVNVVLPAVGSSATFTLSGRIDIVNAQTISVRLQNTTTPANQVLVKNLRFAAKIVSAEAIA
jgi:hypothetical protein